MTSLPELTGYVNAIVDTWKMQNEYRKQAMPDVDVSQWSTCSNTFGVRFTHNIKGEKDYTGFMWQPREGNVVVIRQIEKELNKIAA